MHGQSCSKKKTLQYDILHNERSLQPDMARPNRKVYHRDQAKKNTLEYLPDEQQKLNHRVFPLTTIENDT